MPRHAYPAASRRRAVEDHPVGTVVEWATPPLVDIGGKPTASLTRRGQVTGRITGSALVRMELRARRGIYGEPVVIVTGQPCRAVDVAWEEGRGHGRQRQVAHEEAGL